jgi:hypothetical protein
MSAGSGIRAGAAYVELKTKDDLLTAGLKRAEAKVRAFGAAISSIGSKFLALGSMALVPLLGAATAFAASGSALLLMSQRTGVAVEALSALQFSAMQTGVATEDLQMGLIKMQRTIQAAADGTRKAQESLASLGLTARDLDHMSPDKQFERIAEGLAKIPNATTRAARTLEIFGRGGAALLPLLERGAGGIAALRAEAERLGLVKTREQAEDGHRLEVAFRLARTSVMQLVTSIGGALAPLLEDVAKFLLPITANVRAWIRDNRALFPVILAVTGAVAALGVAFLTVGSAIKMIAMVMAPVIGIAGLLIGLLKTAAIVSGALLMLYTGGFASFGLFLRGMLILAVDVFKTMAIKAALAATNTAEVFRVGFGNTLSIAGDTFAGVSDLIEAGDWAGALELAWAGLTGVFQSALATLRMTWRSFSGFFVDHWNTAVNHISRGLVALLPLSNNVWRHVWGVLGQEVPELQADAIARQQQAFAQQVAAERADFDRRRREFEAAHPGQDLTAELEEQRRFVEERERAARNLGPAGMGGALQGIIDQEQRDRERNKAAADAADRAELERLKQAAEERRLNAAERRRQAELERAQRRVPELANIGAGLDFSREKIDVAGTFSAFAVAGLGAHSVTERIAVATERTADGVERIAQPVFT